MPDESDERVDEVVRRIWRRDAVAHESAAALHDKLAVAWDERQRPATAALERTLASPQRALATASRQRADREREPPPAGPPADPIGS